MTWHHVLGLSARGTQALALPALFGTRFRVPPSCFKGVSHSAAAVAGHQAGMSADQAADHPATSCSWETVTRSYARAQELKAATQTDTQVEVMLDPQLGVEFVVRVATVLKSKPKGDHSGQPSKEWRNPFLPYDPNLWVCHLSETHTLLLNKFNVVPYHLLVVTRQFESQQDPLNEHDFAATLQVLQVMPQGGVAFFNCGEHSGRSQPHKHVQVVPLPFVEGQEPVPPIQKLVDAATASAAPLEPVELRTATFSALACRLPSGLTAGQLSAAAEQMLSRCHEALPSMVPLSYNVLLTRSFLMIIPRKQECSGPCAVNSLAFAGTLLVRSPEELDYVRERGPGTILGDVGVARLV